MREERRESMLFSKEQEQGTPGGNNFNSKANYILFWNDHGV